MTPPSSRGVVSQEPSDEGSGGGSGGEEDAESAGSPGGASTAPLWAGQPGPEEDGEDAPETAQLDLLQSAMQLAVVDGSLTKYLSRAQRVAVTFERARKRLQAIQVTCSRCSAS